MLRLMLGGSNRVALGVGGALILILGVSSRIVTTEPPSTAANESSTAGGSRQTTGGDAGQITTGNVKRTGYPDAIRCFTCQSNDSTDSCYVTQEDTQPSEICDVGDMCWTHRHTLAGMFLNLTRGCSSEMCSDMHTSAEDVSCDEAQDVEVCTQCCAEDLCNKHVNARNGPTAGGSRQTTGGDAGQITTGNVKMTGHPDAIKCFTCQSNDSTDSCYDTQQDTQPSELCDDVKGVCWTHRHTLAGMFLNLTRGCSAETCSDSMHTSAEDVSCDVAQNVKVCTQCCTEDLCNKHVNAGNGLSGCLAWALVSAVVVMAFMG